MASAAGTSDLVHQILPPRFTGIPYSEREDALFCWSLGHSEEPPNGDAAHQQKAWDAPRVHAQVDDLLEAPTNDSSRAHLLAVATEYSRAWLTAMPISSLGLQMDDDTIHIAVGLKLGSTLCHPHQCSHCGAEVDSSAMHGLSCRWSDGRHPRYAAINDLIHRALPSAKVPSRLEPSGLFHSEGKRPDGATIAPWKNGKCLVWDATCPDTFAPSYLRLSSREAGGAVAIQAEERKKQKYSCLSSTHLFTPIAIESSGVFGTEAISFVRELGLGLKNVTGEPGSCHYLIQKLSVTVQRGLATLEDNFFS